MIAPVPWPNWCRCDMSASDLGWLLHLLLSRIYRGFTWFFQFQNWFIFSCNLLRRGLACTTCLGLYGQIAPILTSKLAVYPAENSSSSWIWQPRLLAKFNCISSKTLHSLLKHLNLFCATQLTDEWCSIPLGKNLSCVEISSFCANTQHWIESHERLYFYRFWWLE